MRENHLVFVITLLNMETSKKRKKWYNQYWQVTCSKKAKWHCYFEQGLQFEKETKSLQAAAVKKRKSTNLAKYNAADWLVVNVDKTTNLVQSMSCFVCTKFMDGISSVKGFQQQWREGRSKWLQHNTALEHGESMSHRKALDLHLKSPGLGIQEQTEKE